MKENFLKQTRREYPLRQRLAGMLFLGLIFLALLPFALVYFSARLDATFQLPRLALGVFNPLLGCALMLAGLFFAWWANYVQITAGRGTPVPIMATQRLLTQKPYSFCRNPMALGAILLYLGLAVLIASISGLALVFAGAAVLLTYIRFIEEKEMELRFGEAYQAYRKSTPFIIPHLW